MSNDEKRRYAQIKEKCDFLSESMNLNLGSRPIGSIFYPLLYSGVVDHVGRDYYSLTPPMAIEFDTHTYLLNSLTSAKNSYNLPVGWQLVAREQRPSSIQAIRMNSISVLKSFPSIDKVVDSWNSSLQDIEVLTFHDFRNKIGVAEYLKEGNVRYFVIPNKRYQKEIPSRAANPDAYNIAICYQRALNGRGNGVYDKNTKRLIAERFAFPIMLYRALSLDGMSEMQYPSVQDAYFTFENISKDVAKEVNRILCKSIRYE